MDLDRKLIYLKRTKHLHTHRCIVKPNAKTNVKNISFQMKSHTLNSNGITTNELP